MYLNSFTDVKHREFFQREVVQRHRPVRGVGSGSFSDTRFSALDPNLWKWVGVSAVNMFYQAYVRVHKRRLTDIEKEVVYQAIRENFSYLDLPSRDGKLPATLAEMVRYYDDVAENKLADNEFLQWAYRRFDSLPIPSLVFPARIHPMMQPLWQAITQIAVRPIAVCSAGAAHPKMRELLGIEWTRRDRAEYTIYLVILRALWRWAPRRFVLEPLAHNRYRYEKIRDIYSSVLLESFGPATTETTHDGGQQAASRPI